MDPIATSSAATVEKMPDALRTALERFLGGSEDRPVVPIGAICKGQSGASYEAFGTVRSWTGNHQDRLVLLRKLPGVGEVYAVPRGWIDEVSPKVFLVYD